MSKLTIRRKENRMNSLAATCYFPTSELTTDSLLFLKFYAANYTDLNLILRGIRHHRGERKTVFWV